MDRNAAYALVTAAFAAGCSTTTVTNVYVGADAGDAGRAPIGGDAASQADGVGAGGGDSGASDAADGSTSSCGASATVDDTGLQQCASCTPTTSCSSAAPLGACCTWLAVPKDPLADGIGLHRFSTGDPSAVPDLSCLTQPGALGTPQTVTLTGYVWAFSSGQDTVGVQVDLYAENHPETPDGTIGATPLGTYTTTASDPIDPVDTTWDSTCGGGCSFRQYTIKNVPTETPLVLRTSDAGSGRWVTRYEYDVYVANAAVVGGIAFYDATAMAGPDVETLAATVGLTTVSTKGQLIGEVHDCSDLRLSGATVETNQAHQGTLLYFTSDESNPLPSLQAPDTSDLGLFAALDMQPGTPTRVTAVGRCPPGAAGAAPPICHAGDDVMLGTYVVQMYPGAVTALALRGRRPWQP